MCACGGGCPLCRGVKMMFVFKEKEQKMIKFEDVKVGDRVKLVNENGDTAEVKVEGNFKGKCLYAQNLSFGQGSGWSVAEILEKPMPNKPGTILRWTDADLGDDRYVKLNGDGWVSLITGTKFTDGHIKTCYNPRTVITEYAPE